MRKDDGLRWATFSDPLTGDTWRQCTHPGALVVDDILSWPPCDSPGGPMISFKLDGSDCYPAVMQCSAPPTEAELDDWCRDGYDACWGAARP